MARSGVGAENSLTVQEPGVREGEVSPHALFRLLGMLLLAFLLSGCMLASGEQSVVDLQPAGGSVSTSFVSAEGEDLRTIKTDAGQTVNMVVFVDVAEGELRVDMLDPGGSVVFSTQGRAGERVTHSGRVTADGEGLVRYRVVAHSARKGRLELFYQQQ